MATLTKKPGRTKTVLELEPEEVIALYNVLNSTGGSTSHSGRKFTDGIYNALVCAYPILNDSLNFVSNSVYFNDDTSSKIREIADKIIN